MGGFSRRSVAVEHLHQVIAELALHRAVHLAQGFLEDDLIDRPHHLPGAHFAQVAAALAGRAGGILAREQVEGLAGGDALLQCGGLRFGFHQNVAGHCLCHDEFLIFAGYVLCQCLLRHQNDVTFQVF